MVIVGLWAHDSVNFKFNFSITLVCNNFKSEKLMDTPRILIQKLFLETFYKEIKRQQIFLIVF